MIDKIHPAVSTKNLSFSYGKFPVLESVNIQIPQGDFVCVVGPNGGGKTTLLKLIVGLLRPTQGEVRVFGNNPESERIRIGYMPQHTQLDPQFPATLLDVALMGRLNTTGTFGRYTQLDKEIASQVLDQVGLYELRHKPFSSISGGQRQRLFIARALACEPELLLFDEPTANLDVVMENDLYDLLQRLNEKMTIIMVSHDLGFVSHVIKNVVCVKRKVVMHQTSEISGEIINQIYGSPMRIIRHNGEREMDCYNS